MFLGWCLSLGPSSPIFLVRVHCGMLQRRIFLVTRQAHSGIRAFFGFALCLIYGSTVH